MRSDKQTLLLPLLLITVGVGWLLTTLGVAPRIDWIWTLGLAVVGFSTFALGGFDKTTVVIGPFFIISSLLSVLRQTNRLHSNVEAPLLIIVVGILLLVARLPFIPPPQWLTESETKNQPSGIPANEPDRHEVEGPPR